MKIKTEHFIFDTKKSILSFDNLQSVSQFNYDYFTTFQKVVFKKVTSPKKTIYWLSLIPTLECHGDCPYCYNRSYKKIYNRLTTEKIQSYLDTLKNYDFSQVRFIRTYGGEPFLHEDLYSLYKFLLTKMPKIKNIYISSGLLFEESIFEHALEQLKQLQTLGVNIVVGVSMDFGVPDQDFTRVSKQAGLYSRDQLFERVKRITEIGIEVVFPTIISNKVDPELLKEHIRKYASEYKFRMEIANDNVYYPRKEQLVKIFKFLKDLLDEQDFYVFANTDILNIPKIFKINEQNFLFLFPESFCGTYYNMVSFNPLGVTPCHMIPYTFDLKPSKRFFELHNDQKCKRCDFFPVCRGLCVNRRSYSEEANKSYCMWSKLSFILSIYKISKVYKNKLKEYLNSKIAGEL